MFSSVLDVCGLSGVDSSGDDSSAGESKKDSLNLFGFLIVLLGFGILEKTWNVSYWCSIYMVKEIRWVNTALGVWSILNFW